MKIQHQAEQIPNMGYHIKGLSFPMSEYTTRLKKVRSEIKKLGLDALISTTTENIFYLTGYQTLGYWFFQALVIPLNSPPFMVLRELENPNVIKRTYLAHSFPYHDSNNHIEKLSEALHEFDLHDKKVGVELNSYFLVNADYIAIKQALPDITLIDASNTIEYMRRIKSNNEINIMKKAGYYTKMGMLNGFQNAQIGASENDIAAGFYAGSVGNGGHYMAMPPFVASGPRSYLPHATYMNRTIEPHEFILFEGAGSYLRYHVPCMRTIYTGKPTSWQKDIEALLKNALHTTIKAMKPGITAAQVDQINQNMIQKNTFGGKQTSRSGYSVGIAFSPDWGEGHIISLVKNNNTVLEENMVFHVLSYIEIPNSAHSPESRFGLSDTVYVTQNGGISLVNLEYEICFV